MKLVGYVRVSTAAQAEEGLGLVLQESTVRSWSKDQGHRLVEVLADEGISGAKELDDRPALAEALSLVADKEAAGIVVPRLDRLARDLIVQETVLADVRRHGGRVFSCAAGESEYLADDPSDPSRKLIRQILGSVAEYERSLIALRLRAGRARKASTGGYAYGAPPLGFVAEDRSLQPSESEQATVTRMTELWSSGASLRAICEVLQAEGHRTKRGGTEWKPMVVKRVLDRAQAGSVHHG